MSNVVKFPKKEQDRREELLAELQEMKADIERSKNYRFAALVIGLAIVAGWIIGTLLSWI